MSEVQRVPVELFRLGQYIGEEMEERDWTASDVALRMNGDFGLDAFLIDLILAIDDPACVISDADYGRLEKVFGVSDGFFKSLDAEWRKHPEKLADYDPPEHLFSGARITTPKESP